MFSIIWQLTNGFNIKTITVGTFSYIGAWLRENISNETNSSNYYLCLIVSVWA